MPICGGALCTDRVYENEKAIPSYLLVQIVDFDDPNDRQQE